MSELYRDFIAGKADEIITSLGGTITPAPANAELYRDFLDRKFDDVINAISGFNPVKTFTYTGTGISTNHRIDLPNDCKMILLISPGSATPSGAYDYTRLENCMPILTSGSHLECRIGRYVTNGPTIDTAAFHVDFYEGYILTTAASNSTALNLNVNNVIYTVYYI